MSECVCVREERNNSEYMRARTALQGQPPHPISEEQSGERAMSELACQHHSFFHEETTSS